MKKSNFLKILAPIVALGFLIGALVGISASANEATPASDVKPEIISMNVEYGSELYLYYAVDKATVVGTPVLEILDAEGNVIETVEDYYEDTILGDKAVYVFKAPGTAPKKINVAQKVRAACGEIKGDIKSASVEGYLYAKLYKEGFALKTVADGDDFIRRNLYFQLLKYASFAQQLFFYGQEYEAIGAPGIYAEDAEGIVNGKIDAGLGYITLKSSVKEGFSYWKVDFITPFGDEVETKLLGDGYEVLYGAYSIVATPVYNVDSMDGVEAWDSAVDHFNWMDSAKNVVASNWKNNIETYEQQGKTLIGENNWGIVNEGDNNVLFIDKKCGGMVSYEKDGQIVTEMTEWNAGVYISTQPTVNESGANVAVFEADINMADFEFNDAFVLYFKDAKDKNVVYGSAKAKSTSVGSNFTFYGYKNVSGEDTSFTLGSPNNVKVGEWFHIRVEYRVTSTDDAGNVTGINVTWNIGGNEYSYTEALTAGMKKISDLRYVRFGWNAKNVGEFYVDNVSFKLLAE